MALITCPQCGKQISDRAVKCPHCGFVPGSPKNEQPDSSSDQLQHEAAPKKTQKKWWIIPIIIVGISAIVVPLWIFSNKEKSASEVSKTNGAKANSSPYNTYFSGTIGTARGCMTIDNNGQGSYTYDCNGTDLTRNINVISFDEKTRQLIIKSTNSKGDYIGVFEGYLDDSQLYSGTFTNYKLDKVDFRLFVSTKGNGYDDRSSTSESPSHQYYDNNNNRSDNYVVIDGSELRLRLGPSTSADTFKWKDGTNRHPKVGEKFKYLGESGDFYQIDFNGHRLWVSKFYTHIE